MSTQDMRQCVSADEILAHLVYHINDSTQLVCCARGVKVTSHKTVLQLRQAKYLWGNLGEMGGHSLGCSKHSTLSAYLPIESCFVLDSYFGHAGGDCVRNALKRRRGDPSFSMPPANSLQINRTLRAGVRKVLYREVTLPYGILLTSQTLFV